MPAYLVSAVNIKDKATYDRDYVARTFPTLVAAGAKVLMVSDNNTVLEGVNPGGRLVVIEFASREALMAWYDSDAYKEFRQVRHATADTPFALLVDGVDMSKAPPAQQPR